MSLQLRLGLLVALAACKAKESATKPAGPGSAVFDEAKPEEVTGEPPGQIDLLGFENLDADAQFNIAGGELVSDEPVAGVGLMMVGGTSRPSKFCSATLVSCEAMITARHCVRRGDNSTELVPPTELFVFLPQGGIFGVREVKTHPTADLAVVFLNRPVREIDPVELELSHPPTGGKGYIVGFGRGTGGTPSGLRRGGQVTYSRCEIAATSTPQDGLCWTYSAGHGTATTCVGDSGGPLIDSRTGRQVGVHSSGSSASCGGSDDAVDVNLFLRASDIRGWVPNLGKSCGDMHHVYWGFADEHRTWMVPVKEGVRIFRVGFTGEFAATVDSRLRVELDGVERPTRCDSRPSNAWGYCEWFEPTPGTYAAWVTRARDTDRYQISLMLAW